MCPFPQSLVCNDGQKFIPHNLKYGNAGDTVSYKVKEGYVLVGEPTVCQSNFTWSPPPKCISKHTYLNSYNEYLYNAWL